MIEDRKARIHKNNRATEKALNNSDLSNKEAPLSGTTVPYFQLHNLQHFYSFSVISEDIVVRTIYFSCAVSKFLENFLYRYILVSNFF